MPDAATLLRWYDAVYGLAGVLIIAPGGRPETLAVARPELKRVADEIHQFYLDALRAETASTLDCNGNLKGPKNMDPRFVSTPLYDIYAVTIRMRQKLCGGIPRNKELLADAVRAHTGFDDQETERQIKELGEGVVDEIVEKSWNGFVSDAGGLYLPAFQVKAMFKEVASLQRLTTEKRGSKQVLQHGTFVVKAPDGSDRIHFGKTKPDGSDEGPVHVMTPQGPRTAIKRVDYVMGAELTFHVWVYGTHASESRHIGEDDIIELLKLAQENGLGADRSQGQGTFDVMSFECIQRASTKARAAAAAAGEGGEAKPPAGKRGPRSKTPPPATATNSAASS